MCAFPMKLIVSEDISFYLRVLANQNSSFDYQVV